MTSQRFLNDKVTLRDFLRSLLEACKAPLVTLLFVSLYTIGSVAAFAKGLKKSVEYMALIKNHELISYFGGATSEFEYKDTSPLCILMILCGIVVAFSLFSFMFKKNSVNVYFSMGITRTRLFLNRLAAGAVELFAISVIPYLTVFLINVGLFGYHTYQLKLFAYYTLLMFIRGMSGFAIGAFATAVSGSAIEAVFTAGSSSFILIMAAEVFDHFKNLFLPGYVNIGTDSINKTMLLTPWFALMEGTNHSDLITGKNVPKEYLLTWKTEFFPIALWAGASVIIIAVALLLFKKRKNENTASFGKFAVASGLNGLGILVVSVYALSEIFSGLYSDGKINSIFLCILLSTVISFIIFFVAELIIRRNIKKVLRILPVYGGFALVTFAALLVIGTGYFGTFNKLPDAKEIEYVSMSYSDPYNMLGYNTYYINPKAYDDKTNTDVCKSDNPEDIKVCIDQFNKIKDDKRTADGALDYVNFVIKTKDGKFIVRSFSVYSEEIFHNYSKAVFDSEYFHQILKMKVTNIGSYTSENGYDVYNGISYTEKYDDEDLGNNTFSYFNGSLLSDNFNYTDYSFNGGEAYEFTEEMKEAVYSDLCKMTYDEYYGSVAEPTGAIVLYTSALMQETSPYMMNFGSLNVDGYYYNSEESQSDAMKTGVAREFIPVYPQMTETLEQLGEIEPNPHTASVKAVIYSDKKMSLSETFVNLQGGYEPGNYKGVFVSGKDSGEGGYWLYGNDIDELFAGRPSGTYIEFMEILYSAKGVNMTRVDDKAKAKQISDASRTLYDTYGDNGRYVFVIYDNGCVVSKYLPEKSLSVLN